ncbi:MAG: 30S ribosomal protein S6 [Leptospiraceae bacterium]|nr:30S ribosomal protein S6 [Leptospiraceae bacterium]
MRAYEITAILLDKGTIVEETKTSIKEILTKYSVEITSEEDMGQKKLWHTIGGNETGYFTYIKCKAEPSSIAKLVGEFKLNQNILKSLIVKG